MDVTEAKLRVTNYLSGCLSKGIILAEWDPNSNHDFYFHTHSKDEYYFFTWVSPTDLPHVGGSRTIAISKTNGSIYDLGKIGE